MIFVAANRSSALLLWVMKRILGAALAFALIACGGGDDNTNSTHGAGGDTPARAGTGGNASGNGGSSSTGTVTTSGGAAGDTATPNGSAGGTGSTTPGGTEACVPQGGVCTKPTDCCMNQMAGGRVLESVCVVPPASQPGLSHCAGTCVTGADCVSGCCAPLGNAAVMVCSAPSFCANVCAGAPCNVNGDCCVGTLCVSGGCAAECTTSSECRSGCCALLTGGGYACGPATPSMTCAP